MHVVSAGVHFAHVLRHIVHVVGLCDGQGVHVATQRNHRPVGSAFYHRHNTGLCHAAGVGDAFCLQKVDDFAGGARFVEGEFGVGVQIAPDGNDVVSNRFAAFTRWA